MNRLTLLVESRIRGDVYVRFGGELPKTHRRNTAGRWMLSLPLKSVKGLVRDARKVQQTILMMGDITDIYVNNFQRMLSDPYFAVDELSAIAQGYTILLEESSNVLNDLRSVVNKTELSMTDKDRMDIINTCYDQIYEYRALVQYYTDKNIGVSYLRARKAQDHQRVLDLYGNPNERYW